MATNLTDEQMAHNKIMKMKILFSWVNKKAHHEKVYTVDTNKPVKIGGMSEDGYMLRFYTDGKPSDTCITYTNLLKIASGKTICQHIFTVKEIL